MRRAFAPALAAVLAACSGGEVPQAAEGNERLACALGGASEFSNVCAADRITEGDRRLLVVRHPDGAFRRFVLTADGREVLAADGADEADLELVDGALVVRVGSDRYRLALPVGGAVDAS